MIATVSVRYSGPTDTRGSGWVANARYVTHSARVFVPFDYSQDNTAQSDAAAERAASAVAPIGETLLRVRVTYGATVNRYVFVVDVRGPR